jgi:hypothetical protein
MKMVTAKTVQNTSGLKKMANSVDQMYVVQGRSYYHLVNVCSAQTMNSFKKIRKLVN